MKQKKTICFFLLGLSSQLAVPAKEEEEERRPRRRFAVLVRGEAYRGFWHPKFELQSAKEQVRCTRPTVAPLRIADCAVVRSG